MPSRSLEHCEPTLAEAWRGVARDYAISRPDRELVITCTRRSVEEQQMLYAQGRTKPGQIVTQIDGVTKKSNHNLDPARALDFAVVVNGKISWDPAVYEEPGRLAETYGLVWGGRWKSLPDYPHVELPKEA